ncbi:hypothetical protein GGD81_001428 [Rhodobium orientis]|nr:DUF6653 family protein [Rhodobium orientis]MBB4302401.1 hypothetical protein [Rhodobium orientis]
MKKGNKDRLRYDEWLSRLFRMDDGVWRRHASGWSVWTRAASLPLLVLAVWSHRWIGIGGALCLVGLVVVWIYLNPRIFPAPKRTDTWHARATFGERVWLNRHRIPIPRHHAVVAHLLAGIAATGAVIALWGTFLAAFWPTLVGIVIVLFGKFWFLDRMVWLYQDMKDMDPIYRSWERIPVNDNEAARKWPRRKRREG